SLLLRDGCYLFFFFQAEDGIRDRNVTGVQTCALPISVTFHLVGPTPPSLFFTAISDPLGMGILDAAWLKSVGADITFTPDGFLRSEERRVGKEWRSWEGGAELNKKKKRRVIERHRIHI